MRMRNKLNVAIKEINTDKIVFRIEKVVYYRQETDSKIPCAMFIIRMSTY